jgi:GTP cyclohydrolase FolE2
MAKNSNATLEQEPNTDSLGPVESGSPSEASNTTTSEQDSTDKVEAEATEVSPYKATALVNKALEEAGLDTKLPPQMMYQYASEKKQYIKSHKNEAGKIMIELSDLFEWIEKYITKKVAGLQKKADEAAAALEKANKPEDTATEANKDEFAEGVEAE